MARDVEDGVRVTLGGIGMGCFPMFDMNPHTRAEVLNRRRALMANGAWAEFEYEANIDFNHRPSSLANHFKAWR